MLRARTMHAKDYVVEVDRPLREADLEQLAAGVVITTTAQRDRGPPKTLTAPTLPCAVERRAPTTFAITLREGRKPKCEEVNKLLHGAWCLYLEASETEDADEDGDE